MARLSILNFASYCKYLNKKVQFRHISTTRRLLSQEWQQEGIPGANLPFNINTNKYLHTLKCFLYFASGLWAPFIIFAIALKRIYGVQETVPDAELTSVYCTE